MSKLKKMTSAFLAGIITAALFFSGCSSDEKKETGSSSSDKESSVSQKSSAVQSSKTQSNTQSSDSGEKSETSSDTNSITPLIWEVTDAEGNKMYMMGTIHLGDDAIDHMPDYFESAFAKCDAVALECDSSETSMDLDSIARFMYTDGTTIKDHVSEEDYNNAVKILQDSGMFTKAYDYVKPFMWLSLAEVIAGQNVGLSADYGVDTMLETRGRKNNKEIIELEGADFQTEVIASLPDELQELMFHEMAQTDDYMTQLQNEMKEIYQNWKDGKEITDNSDSSDTDEESLSEEDQKLVDEYNRIMLYDRNEGMADKAETYIKSDKLTFLAVGAAHFTGDKGIKKIMEDRGYTFRPLTSKDAEDIDKQISEQESALDADVSILPDVTDPSIPRAA